MSNYKYTKIWKENFGDIPIDENGRIYEIHHIDNNRNNNNIENLLCLSIKEHYDIHYINGDYGACVLIAKRIGLPINHISNIQKGIKRPGIGGVKKGTIPWNKGKTGYNLILTEEGQHNKNVSLKKRSIIKDYDAFKIRMDFENKIEIINEFIGTKKPNGRIFTYERAFCLEYAKLYNVSDQYIYRILRGKSKIV